MTTTPQILLVEDLPMDIRLTEEILRHSGVTAEMFAVTDGAQALDFLYQRGDFAHRAPGYPLLVLLDLKMPRVDGFDVLRQIKGDPNLKVIPIIVLTSSTHHDDIRRAYDLGANAYMVKEIDFPTHAAGIEAAVRFWLHVNMPPPLCARRNITGTSLKEPAAESSGSSTPSGR